MSRLSSELAGLGPNDKRKQSFYVPIDMLREIKLEADRQERSLSWVMQRAWQIARQEIMHFPAVPLVDKSRASAHGGALEQ